MKGTAIIAACLLTAAGAGAENRTYDPQVKSLVATVNQDWLSPPVMRLGGQDVLHVGFDELSHDNHRYIARIERREADWTASEELFESDWLEGFNDNVIDDWERSINTTVPYTHYRLEIPDDRCRLKMSGNYRLLVIDEDSQETVLKVEFMVTEQTMGLAMAATTNTDISTNTSHQQVALSLNYGGHAVTSPEDQVMVVVMQNGREDNRRLAPRPSSTTPTGLEWQHCRSLIFDAGNEYRKYEILDPSHPTMGIDRIDWDGAYYQVYPNVAEPRYHYLYDEDADGAFYIRNSDNRENETASDYVWVNYRLQAPRLSEGHVVKVNGRWTTGHPSEYRMDYDEEQGLYTAAILQKQGYYNYQCLTEDEQGQTGVLPSEGNFYQTENRYQAMVYYRGTGDRTWRLTAYRQIELK